MAQAKKKQSTKTAKKTTRTKSTKAQSRSSRSRKTACDNKERNHIYFVTALGLITAILLCANAVFLIN